MQKILLTVCAFACAAAAQAFRPPAVPLVSVDPFFSVWSAADRLTDVEATHWSGAKQPITVLLEADGRTWRLCGATPADVPALPQLATEVRPTQTVCTFAEGALRVELRFSTAKLPDDLDVFSRPVTYVTARVQGARTWRLKPSMFTRDLALIAPLYRFANETPDRVPFTDWYWADNGRYRGFVARSVVGGVFLPALYDRELWKKYASRGADVNGAYAPVK